MTDAKTLTMYSEIASWWPLLSAPEDYAEEAALYRQYIESASKIPIKHVLELGSGGGNNASHLKQHYTLTLVDMSPGMLEVSRQLNPECEHIQGDMRTVRLNRQFDAVFIHDAICYMTRIEDLRQAIETAYVHCKPGGVALFVPDSVRETFKPYTSHGGHDGDGRAMRFLEWTFDPDPDDDTCVSDYVYLLREGNDPVQVHHERHIFGLFACAAWLNLIREIGFEPDVTRSTIEGNGTYQTLFTCLKPGE